MATVTTELVLAVTLVMSLTTVTFLLILIIRTRLLRGRGITVRVQLGPTDLTLSAKGPPRDVNRVLNQILSSIENIEEATASVAPGSASEIGFRVIHLFNRLENLAGEFALLLRPQLGQAGRRLSPFETLRILQAEGVWSSEESEKFQRIAKLRNTIVHANEYSDEHSKDADRALDDAAQLITSLEVRIKREAAAVEGS